MKIVDRKKFVRGMVIITSILLFIFLISLSSISLSHGEMQYKEIYVGNGETLWSIATSEINTNAYYIHKDVRAVIKDIKTINELESSVLQIGQKLIIPTL